jgi:hypothetical protein
VLKVFGCIDNCAVRTGLCYLIDRMTARNVRNDYWRNDVANTACVRAFFVKVLSSFLFVIGEM